MCLTLHHLPQLHCESAGIYRAILSKKRHGQCPQPRNFEVQTVPGHTPLAAIKFRAKSWLCIDADSLQGVVLASREQPLSSLIHGQCRHLQSLQDEVRLHRRLEPALISLGPRPCGVLQQWQGGTTRHLQRFRLTPRLAKGTSLCRAQCSLASTHTSLDGNGPLSTRHTRRMIGGAPRSGRSSSGSQRHHPGQECMGEP